MLQPGHFESRLLYLQDETCSKLENASRTQTEVT